MNSLSPFFSEQERGEGVKKNNSSGISRAVARFLLAHYLNVEPKSLVFISGEYGKPKLLNDPPLFFNISHTDSYFAILISKEGEVGIDIEEVDPKMKGELEDFFSQKKALSTKALFRAWTRLEALGKAQGKGIDYKNFGEWLFVEGDEVEFHVGKKEFWNIISFEPIPNLVCSISYGLSYTS